MTNIRKKIFFAGTLLASLFFLSCVNSTSGSSGETEENLINIEEASYFKIYKGEILGFNDTVPKVGKLKVTIPTESIEGYPITKIGKIAFDGEKNIAKVTIGDTVTEICESAFRNCTTLTEISIPESVETMGAHVFLGCSATNLTIKYNGTEITSDFSKPAGWDANWDGRVNTESGEGA